MNKEILDTQTAHWLKILIEVAILIFAVGLAWSSLRGDVEDNTKDIEKHDIRIGSVEGEMAGVKTNIAVIKGAQTRIAEDISKIEKKL